MKMLGHAGENRDGLTIAALSQKGRSHTLAKASVRFVTNDIDNEMDRLGKNSQTTRHRVKPRLQFRYQANELRRSKFGRMMLQAKIDDLHPPEINLEIVFMVGTKQFL